MMGLTDSTYHACQAVTQAKWIALGYRCNLKTLSDGINW